MLFFFFFFDNRVSRSYYEVIFYVKEMKRKCTYLKKTFVGNSRSGGAYETIRPFSTEPFYFLALQWHLRSNLMLFFFFY